MYIRQNDYNTQHLFYLFIFFIIYCSSKMILIYGYFPFPRGGVFPPGAAFINTSLRARLEKKGIHFTVVE